MGLHFDRCLTWAAVIDMMVSHCRQRLGFLDSNTLQLTYEAFMRSLMEYGDVTIMGASANH